MLSPDSLSYSFVTRTLSCISSGGPATTVTWTKESMSLLSSSTTHIQSQRVVDTITSTYHNLLFINSRDIRDYNATYGCTVSNSRGNSSQLVQKINGSKIHVLA